jgi:hypothetical protein
MGCGDHAFLRRGAAQAACLEKKLEKKRENIRTYVSKFRNTAIHPHSPIHGGVHEFNASFSLVTEA